MGPSGFLPLSPKTPPGGPGRPQRREGVSLVLPGDRSSSGDDARIAEGKKMCCRVCRLPHLFSTVLSTGAKWPISSCRAGQRQGPGTWRSLWRPLPGGPGHTVWGGAEGSRRPSAKGQKPMTLHGSTFALRSKNLPSVVCGLELGSEKTRMNRMPRPPSKFTVSCKNHRWGQMVGFVGEYKLRLHCEGLHVLSQSAWIIYVRL